MQCNLHIFTQITYDLILLAEHRIQLFLYSHAQLMFPLHSFVNIVNLLSHICQNLLQVAQAANTT